MVMGLDTVSRELSEYRLLYSTLDEFHGKFQRRKLELRRLLGETAALKKDALMVLARANRLTRHLTGGQRQLTGISYHLGEIKARINQLDKSSPALSGGALEEAALPLEIPLEIQGNLEESRNRLELKQRGLMLLGLIDRVKKQLLQLDLLELRCRELIASIKKAMEAFRHEFNLIRRKIYPFGIFSFFRRSLSSLFGYSYFSPRDLGEISSLGRMTGYVLKIADSPLF